MTNYFCCFKFYLQALQIMLNRPNPILQKRKKENNNKIKDR